jgi:hypothetical protein
MFTGFRLEIRLYFSSIGCFELDEFLALDMLPPFVFFIMPWDWPILVEFTRLARIVTFLLAPTELFGSVATRTSLIYFFSIIAGLLTLCILLGPFMLLKF